MQIWQEGHWTVGPENSLSVLVTMSKSHHVPGHSVPWSTGVGVDSSLGDPEGGEGLCFPLRHLSRDVAMGPGSTSECTGASSSWQASWSREGLELLRGGRGPTFQSCSLLSSLPLLSLQAAFDLLITPLHCQQRLQLTANFCWPADFLPPVSLHTWLVKSGGISTPLTSCATTVQMHFRFYYYYYYCCGVNTSESESLIF